MFLLENSGVESSAIHVIIVPLIHQECPPKRPQHIAPFHVHGSEPDTAAHGELKEVLNKNSFRMIYNASCYLIILNL